MTATNILYIHSHDTGRYVQPYGHAISTPNIQALAEQGVLFRQAFSAAPTCSPSRAALLTGRWPHCCGMHGLATDRFGYTLHDYDQHLANTLRENGYETALSGVQHVARLPWHSPHQMGYERLLNYDDDRWDPEQTLPAAIDFLSGPHDRPFFLSVGFLETHRDGKGDRRSFQQGTSVDHASIDGRYCMPHATLPDTPETRQEMAYFKEGAAGLDRKVGGILKALEGNGLEENTLVICTTDHGPPFPEMKCALTDHGIGVMLIMRGPGRFTGGRVIDALVSHIDVYPTLCEVLDIPRPSWLQGRSMLPLLAGEEEINEEIFAEQGYHGHWEPLRCVRTRRFKYIRRFDGREDQNPNNIDSGPAFDLWLKHGWENRKVGQEQLYDLVFDPHEAGNLAGHPGYREVLMEMRARLQDWMSRTEDPLLTGDIPEPPAWSHPRWQHKR